MESKLNKISPDEFKDAKKRSFLMREFRPRDANPEGYDDKLNFWIRSINKWSFSSGLSSSVDFNVKQIREAFESDGQVPESSVIKLALYHMMSKGLIVKREDYVQSLRQKIKNNSSWVSWGLSHATKPISWGWSIVYGSSSEVPVETSDSLVSIDDAFINMDSFEASANELFDSIVRNSNPCIMRCDDVKSKYGISSVKLDLILLYLESERKCVQTTDCGVRMVKFGSATVPNFTQTDLAKFKLDSAEKLIERDIQQLEDEKDKLDAEARAAVREKQKDKALKLLQKKRKTDVLILKKETQLDNIQHLMYQMSESSSQPLIVNAFKQAADVLKEDNKRSSMIHRTIDEVEDAVAERNEIMSDILRPLNDADLRQYGLNDDELLERELNDLLADDSAQVPPVPSKTVPSEPPRAESKESKEEQELQQLLDRLEKLKQNDEEVVKEKVPAKKVALPSS